jgi:uncharacterized RDD family membrane protein YckC
VSDLRPYPEDAAEREAAQEPFGRVDREYASWGRRAVAYLLDALVVVGIIFVVALAIALVGSAVGDNAAFLVVSVVLIIGLPVFYFVYYVGNERGQTYGRRALGIQVRSSDTGGPVGYGRAFGRYAITFLFGIFTFPLIIDYLWPLWDSRNQTLHDKAASTIVVRL